MAAPLSVDVSALLFEEIYLMVPGIIGVLDILIFPLLAWVLSVVTAG